MSHLTLISAVSLAPPPPPRDENPSAMPAIVRLDPAVVNRIAAGEVVQRPCNALKEMIENSLDAGSTSISVVVKGGGLGSLVITDNGHGIAPGDFPLVCERFATSKLTAFEDLTRVETYGFRGEALASISHVARVTITSMTAGGGAAYRANFANGRMVGEPKPCAGVRGTTICVEDMFYNVPARRAALRNPSEEYARILEVVERYSIQHAARGISFSCKKAGDSAPDLAISARATTLDAISTIFGNSVRRELIPLSASLNTDDAACTGGTVGVTNASADADASVTPSFSAAGYVSNANFSQKKGVCIFFINARLVDCPPLRKALEAVYSEVLPKNTHPFIYLNLTLPLMHVDVNVHPTKREVGFIFEDELVSTLVAALTKVLAGANTSRAFATQTVLPISALTTAGAGGGAGAGGDSLKKGDGDMDVVDESESLAAPWALAPNLLTAYYSRGSVPTDGVVAEGADGGASDAKIRRAPPPAAAKAPKSIVRVDHRLHGAMDAFLVPREPAAANAAAGDEDVVEVPEVRGSARAGDIAHDGCSDDHSEHEHGAGDDAAPADADAPRVVESLAEAAAGSRKARRSAAELPHISLTSVRSLLAGILSDAHEGLTRSVREAVLVGVIDRHLSLIAHGTTLLLINHTQFARELFYQQTLRLFSGANSFALQPPLNVCVAIRAALDANGISDASAREGLAKEATLLLSSKVEMLREYFSIHFEPKTGADEASAENLTPRKRARASGGSAVAAGESALFLTALPRLVDGHCPQLTYLPDFLLSLAFDVDWTGEDQCFHTVAAALAAFYAHPPPIPIAVLSAMATGSGACGAETTADEATLPSPSSVVEAYRASTTSVHSLVAHVLLPAFKAGLVPPRKLALNHHAVVVASAEKLYSVFERC